MPLATVRGVDLNYEVLGSSGPWVTYCGGGRSDLESARPVAELIAQANYRVVIHDRRNTGASDVSIDDPCDEQVTWAEDIFELLRHLEALPVFAGGASAGCRLSLMLAIRHPEAVKGLFVSRPSGGDFAARYLAESNYDDFLEAARRGGMGAVCEDTSMRDMIARRPTNRERLMNMDPGRFIETLERWRRYFSENGELTLIGASDEELRTIDVPVCIVAGQDDLHPRDRSERFHDLIPRGEINYLFTEDDVDRVRASKFTGAYATIQESPDDLARIYIDFLDRVSRPETS
jgi:pimeloyl-ACP methyl ester carboxylesterase